MLGQKLRIKHPDRVPVIVISRDFDLQHSKYLVPSTHTIAQFITMIRSSIDFSKNEALFLLIQNTLVPTNSLFSSTYDTFKDPEDDILYIHLVKENTFG